MMLELKISESSGQVAKLSFYGKNRFAKRLRSVVQKSVFARK
jgi:hypothetical protein